MDPKVLQLEQELKELREKYNRLQHSEFRYRMIYDHSYVSIWEEDYSEVYKLLKKIKQQGVSDIARYLHTHPEVVKQLTRMIRVLDVNQATLQMYNAATKEEFLGSLGKTFIPESLNNFILEMEAVAAGKRYYEGETVGRKLTGEIMDLLLRITIPEEEGQGDYSKVLVSLMDITARKQRERENIRLLRLAESLRTTSLALTASLNRDKIIDIILDECKQNINYSAVSVWQYVDTQLSLTHHRSDFTEPLALDKLEKRYNQPDSFLSQTLQGEGKPVLISDTRDIEECSFEKKVRSFLAIPIIVRDACVGIINFCGDRPGMFSEETLATLEAYINSAAVALENSRLYEEAQKEISVRKQAEEHLRSSLYEKNILLMEIHHRVKNNLNVVASLLNLQANQIESVDQAQKALQLSQSRVHSMALVHEKLYQSSELAHIDMSDYISRMVEELVQLYADKSRIELDLHIEDITLTITQAVPFGLLLNELVTNSLIHAFPDGQQGKISVRLSSETEGECSLEVCDTGIGFSDTKNLNDKTSLGLQLVEVLSEQLHGDAQLHNEGGACFRLSFPLDPA
ncbi:MAG: GAF domain-containing protein [Spirochaetaceae bacterium]|nr:GAF domain-containing protein [Spirochaetaceae bacterium]